MIARERGNVAITDREAAHGEAGERQIDRFIEHRSRQASPGSEEASELARRQARVERDEAEDRAALRRELWRRHHSRLAGIHAALAEQNRIRAERLAREPRNGRA